MTRIPAANSIDRLAISTMGNIMNDFILTELRELSSRSGKANDARCGLFFVPVTWGSIVALDTRYNRLDLPITDNVKNKLLPSSEEFFNY